MDAVTVEGLCWDPTLVGTPHLRARVYCIKILNVCTSFSKYLSIYVYIGIYL